MNLYDFDKTVYLKDCTVEFWKHCLRRKPYLIFGLPMQVLSCVIFKLKLKPREYFKEKFLFFVKHFKDIDAEIRLFWEKEEKNICAWFADTVKADDIIISASPEFLVKPMADKFGIRCIASVVDEKSGRFLSKNCKGQEKIARLAQIGVTEAEKAFSDSKSDLPMLSLAKEGCIIRNKNTKEYVITETITNTSEE